MAPCNVLVPARRIGQAAVWPGLTKVVKMNAVNQDMALKLARPNMNVNTSTGRIFFDSWHAINRTFVDGKRHVWALLKRHM